MLPWGSDHNYSSSSDSLTFTHLKAQDRIWIPSSAVSYYDPSYDWALRNRGITPRGNKYMLKYHKNAVLIFHSLACYTSLQNEQRDVANIIWILELPFDYSHWSKHVRWAGEAASLKGKKWTRHHSYSELTGLWLLCVDCLNAFLCEKLFHKAQLHFQNSNKAKAPGAGKKIRNVHTFESIPKKEIAFHFPGQKCS